MYAIRSYYEFSILNLPALDATPESNYLYTFIDDPAEDNYAPVSLRHLPTYSRGNLQEDFANSMAAYIHYPYFRLSHPERYRFLRDRITSYNVCYTKLLRICHVASAPGHSSSEDATR